MSATINSIPENQLAFPREALISARVTGGSEEAMNFANQILMDIAYDMGKGAERQASLVVDAARMAFAGADNSNKTPATATGITNTGIELS